MAGLLVEERRRAALAAHLQTFYAEVVLVKCDVCNAQDLRFIPRRGADPHAP